MLTHDDSQTVPPDCFPLETIELFQAFEGRHLEGVNYYYWTHPDRDAGFLYYLELLFDGNEALMLSSGEDSAAITVGSAAELVAMAGRLQQLHGQTIIQRYEGASMALWQPLLGDLLRTIQLSRHDSGLYANDALLLDFGPAGRILVHLGKPEGLVVRAYT